MSLLRAAKLPSGYMVKGLHRATELVDAAPFAQPPSLRRSLRDSGGTPIEATDQVQKFPLVGAKNGQPLGCHR
jgi:hypothetical protein